MSYVPPGVTPPAPFGAGVHDACILVDFRVAPASKKCPGEKGYYQFAYVAKYRDTTGNGTEIEEWIRWTGAATDDHSGRRIERLHAIFGAEPPASGQIVDCKALLELSDGVFFTIEMKENGQYLNIADVRANDANTNVAGF